MNTTQKITQEELDELRSQQTLFQKYLFELGTLEYDISILNDQLNQLNIDKKEVLHDLNNLKNKSEVIQKELSQKYGENIYIDINTGDIKFV